MTAAPERVPPWPATARTTLQVHPERGAPDEIADILEAGIVAHVGIVDDGVPIVLPMIYQYDRARPRELVLHGGHHSRLLQCLERGAPISATVTLLDGLVYSRTALYHSANYRSAICFGRGTPIMDPDRTRALSEAMIARCFSGRASGRDYDPIPDAHLTATAFVIVEITEASAKCRRGGPKGPRDNEPEALGSAGVLVFDPPHNQVPR